MKKFFLLSVLSIFALFSCTSEKTMEVTIASKKFNCGVDKEQECLLAKMPNSTEWECLCGNIKDFNYEEGFEYVIEIKEIKEESLPNTPPTIKYVFVKEISKTAKTSENMPMEEVKAEVYECTAKVLTVNKEDIGKGGAAGKVSATVTQLLVTSSMFSNAKQGDTIYAELLTSPKITPVINSEYVFKAKHIHPAHAKGVYLLETDVMDLVH